MESICIVHLPVVATVSIVSFMESMLISFVRGMAIPRKPKVIYVEGNVGAGKTESAVGDRGGIAGEWAPIGRGFACFGVVGGGGGGLGRALSATRALSSSSGEAGGSSSPNDKLAAKRLIREQMEETRGAGVGERAAGGAARGGRGGSGAGARSGGRGGGGGRGGRGAGGGKGPSPDALLNGRISSENDPERLLRLVAAELPNFNDVNVATAFRIFGTLCDSRSFPRNIAADDGFRELMALARTMCADGRLQEQAVANIIHAAATMSKVGKLAAADADVQDTLAALEQRVVRVASDMAPQGVSNAIYGFAVLGREPGAETWAALEAAVVRVAPGMKPQEVSNTSWALATLGLMPGAEARAALEAALVRVGTSMKP